MKDKGYDISLPMREDNLSSMTSNDGLRYIINKLGDDTIMNAWSEGSEGISSLRKDITDALIEFNQQEYGDSIIREEDIDPDTNALYFADLDNIAYAMTKLINDPNAGMRVDRSVNPKVDSEQEYTKWLNDLFSDVRVQKGIRNDRDMFTPSGQRRSFEQLHYDYNLDNILKQMLNQSRENEKGANTGFFGTTFGNIAATQKQEFRSIDDIISNEDMIQNTDTEEAKKRYDELSQHVLDITQDIRNSKKSASDAYFDESSDAVKEIIQQSNKESALAYAKGEFSYMGISDSKWSQIIDDIFELKEPLSRMATSYFEAKPKRIVYPNEIQKAVIPNNSSQELRDRLNNLGINYVEYDPNVEGDRQAKINGLEDLKFSVSEGSLRTNEQVLDTNYTDEELSHLIKGKDFTNKEMSVQKFAGKYATKEENQTLRRLWLGKVSDEFADKVFADIGEDIHGRSLVLTSNWLYHTFKGHDETAYKIQGNAKSTDVNMINHIADIIENYDRCHYDPNGKYGKTLTFETDSDGGYKYNGFSLISEKTKTNKILVLADVYTYKGKQKGVSRPLNDTKMPLNRTTANNAPIERAPSTNNISNDEENVNDADTEMQRLAEEVSHREGVRRSLEEFTDDSGMVKNFFGIEGQAPSLNGLEDSALKTIDDAKEGGRILY